MLTGVLAAVAVLTVVIAMAAVVTAGLAGLEDSSSGRAASPAPQPSPTASTSPPESSPAAPSPSPVPSKPPKSPTTPATTSVPPAPRPSPPALTGYGATVEAWEDEHGKSNPKYDEGSVYGGLVRPGMHEYFAVIADPTVMMYSRGFPKDASLEYAKREVLRDFPPDARITVVDDAEPTCEIVLIESRTVKRATGTWAIAAFFSEQDPDDVDRTPLDRGDVSDATVFSHYEGRIKDLGMC